MKLVTIIFLELYIFVRSKPSTILLFVSLRPNRVQYCGLQVSVLKMDLDFEENDFDGYRNYEIQNLIKY